MNRIRDLSVTVTLAALVVAGLSASPASATAAAGTWTQYPTGGTEYLAEVQQPINSANTSNWSVKSKGGIPVMYKLSSKPLPAAFESIGSTPNTADDFAFLSFAPSEVLRFSDLTELQATYDFSLGDCHGGSLRWQVRVDSNLNGLNDPKTGDHPTGDGAVFIYYGTPPSFGNDLDGIAPYSPVGGCDDANNQSGVDLLDMNDLRFDSTQLGGPFYGDYATAVALTGNARVWRASLVLDSGWQYQADSVGGYASGEGDQRLSQVPTPTTATVNENTDSFDSNSGGTFAPTCDLPTAKIDVTRVDPQPDGAVNETTVYPQSATYTDDQFRVVDCKYQYVLSIPSLATTGAGTYDVEILIDGIELTTNPNPPSEVRFDLR